MFEVSMRAEYGMRAMSVLAARWGQPPIGLSQIAERQAISFKYLEQLMRPLNRSGLVRAVRGKRGGYVLTRPPAEITIAELLEALAGPIRLVECASARDTCRLLRACTLKPLWDEAADALRGIFRRKTLADLVPLAARPKNHLKKEKGNR